MDRAKGMKIAIAALASAVWCMNPMAGATKKIIFPAGAKPAGPYSPGVLAGGFLFVSGQGAKGADGKFPEDPAAQVRQCLDNVKTIVEAAGLTMQQVAYTQVYVPEPWNYKPVEAVWKEYFGEHGPARAVLEWLGCRREYARGDQCHRGGERGPA